VRLQIQNGKIKIEDGIRYITKIVYPDEFNSNRDSRRSAIKRVRARVQYAREQGILTSFDSGRAINMVQFFCWAGEQKNWQAL
jgi:hypothetical protein